MRLMQYRAKHVVPQRMEEMRKAILARDFDTFGRLTMQDSNQFHAICLDTYPPIAYMNDISRDIVRVVTAWNAVSGCIRAAYTFDAGPNAVLFVLEPQLRELAALMAHCFPSVSGDVATALAGGAQPPQAVLDTLHLKPTHGAVQYVIHTVVGDGPRVLPDEADCLLSAVDGMPKQREP